LDYKGAVYYFQEELSRDQKEAALPELPNLLEMFSHCFFIGGYFVGPQFSMKKFQVPSELCTFLFPQVGQVSQNFLVTLP
jgi:hypothetical protein